MAQINQDRRDQRVDEAQNEERREQLRPEDVAHGIARYDEETPEGGLRFALVGAVMMLVNRHLVSTSRCVPVAVLHRLEEYVLERIAFEVEPPDLHAVLEGEAVKIGDLHVLLHDQLHTAFSRECKFAAELSDRFDEGRAVAAACFELDEFTVRFAFLF